MVDMKKEWHRIIAAVIFAFAAVLFLIAFIDVADAGAKFTVLCSYLAGLIFFVGACAYVICKMFSVSCAKWVMLAIGVLNTIFMIIALASADRLFNYLSAEVWYYWTPFVVFALLPLVKGIKKVLAKEDVAQ